MNRFLIRSALVAAAFVALQSCGKLYLEDMEDCYDGVSVALKVDPSTSRATDAEAAAEHAVIYVFDVEGNFLERRETEVGKVEYFQHRNAGSLRVVGWINKHLVYDVTSFGGTVLRQHGLVTLNTVRKTRTDGTHDFPTDLFYGEAALANESVPFEIEHQDIFASRSTGQATVTIRALKDYAGIRDDDFYIVTGPTASAVDFFGNFLNHDATHTPDSGFNAAGEYVTGNFNLMPADDNTPMTVQIWHRTAGLIYEAAMDNSGEPIHVDSDRTTHILIDFTMGVSITIEQTLWNVSAPWKAFNR